MGCFGNDPEDREKSREVDEHLNSLDWRNDDESDDESEAED